MKIELERVVDESGLLVWKVTAPSQQHETQHIEAFDAVFQIMALITNAERYEAIDAPGIAGEQPLPGLEGVDAGPLYRYENFPEGWIDDYKRAAASGDVGIAP